jgi:hypothetical protein
VKYIVLTEEQTLTAAQTVSIARFGDGEWRCAIGGGCTSQRPDAKLAAELKEVLRRRVHNLLVCLPHRRGPRAESWARYEETRYTQFATQPVYGSAFITRPDNAPWIDTPAFWDGVRDLWRGQHVVLVVGDKKSITSEMIEGDAASTCELWGPRQHAYEVADELEAQIVESCRIEPRSRVLLCLGVTATVLAARLAARGIHALDLGHIGMFMRHAGAYRFSADDVVSPEYREILAKVHAKTSWGADGAKHAAAVDQIAEEMAAVTVLDYGCGAGKLAEALKDRRRVSGYDPGIPDKAKMPKPCDLVVCTDVLEHVEPEKLAAVLEHLYRLAARKLYAVIALRPANAILPDGRNAHLIVEDAEWWLRKLGGVGWQIERSENTGKEIRVLFTKPPA